MATHWIREADVASPEDRDQDVLSIRTSWDQTPRQIAVADPTVQQKQIQWYLDEFAAKEPLAARRAAEARHILQRYCESIATQASPPAEIEGLGGEGARGPQLIDVVAAGDDSRMHAAPWEAIEADPRFVHITSRFFRSSVRSPPSSPGTSRNSNAAAFRILLVAARAAKGDADLYGQVAQPLARIIDALPQGPGTTRVTLDIARPGTFAALRERLESASAAGEPYQLVHFDLHGKIESKKAWLCFTDDPVQGRHVASLLAEHGVTFAVLNACNSAAAAAAVSRPRQSRRRGLVAAAEANLARVLVEHRGGVSHVLAMSYRLQISAVQTVTTAFYTALLRDRMSFATSAAAARRALRDGQVRAGRFGLDVEVLDWIVPVVYTARVEDPVVVVVAVPRPPVVLSEKASARPRRLSMLRWPARARGRSAAGPHEFGHESIRGRDGDILALETQLAQNKEDGVTHPLLVVGERGCGKTTLLRNLARWWPKTGWVSRVVYLDLETTPAESPAKLAEMVAQALAADEVRSLPVGAPSAGGGGGGLTRNGVSRSTLVILDHFQVGLPVKLKAGDLTQFYSAAREWKACLAGLSSSATYTIVASHHFPWYIDKSADTTWPWTAYHQLGPPQAEARLVADVAGTERSLRGILGTRRDCDVFAEISAWAAVHIPLHEAIVSLCRARGVRAVSRLLRTNTDLLAVEGFDIAGSVTRSRAYLAAHEVWRQCSEMERTILLGLSPFQGCLPRCIQSYAVSFVLGGLRLRSPVRDHFSRHAPAASVEQFWATVNPSKAALAIRELELLILKLKKLGWITSRLALGPAPTVVPELAGRLYDVEGTKMYSMHPVLTVFLRHQAAREGYRSLGSSQDEKTLLLTQTFVEYHELRAQAWMARLATLASATDTNATAQWDTYAEFSSCKPSFVAALELQLDDPQLSGTDDDDDAVSDAIPPAPLFLAWCLLTASGFGSQFVLTRFSTDDLREYCEAAWPAACRRLRISASRIPMMMLRRPYTAPTSVLFLSVSLSVCLHLGVYMMEQYLSRGQHDKIQQLLDSIDVLLALFARPPVDVETLCALNPQGVLGQLLEVVDAFRAITRGDEVCPELGFLEILARRRPRCSGPGWDAVHKIASLYRGVAGLMQNYERLKYWDANAPSAIAEDIKTELDRLVVEELEPVWDAFLGGLGSETLAQLQLAGFAGAEQVLLARIVRGGDLAAADTDALSSARLMQQELPEAAPDYISARIQGIRTNQSQATTDRLYQEAHGAWQTPSILQPSGVRRQRQRQRARLQLYEDTVLRLPDDTTRDYLELSQIRTYMATGDYGPLLEYLDLVADDTRFAASLAGGQNIDAALQNAVRKTRLHNCKAACALMLRDFALAQQHLDAAFATATTTHNSPGVAAVLFATCRVQIALYRKALTGDDHDHDHDGRVGTRDRLLGAQMTARPCHEVVTTALELGYSQTVASLSARELYARNGALLSLLLESALPTPASVSEVARGRRPLVTPAQLAELLGRLLPAGGLSPD